MEKHLDHKYEWNEWALRRRALQLANLRTKATHSAQTNLSHFRRDGETQVWLPKEAATQSGIAGTNKMTKKVRGVEHIKRMPPIRRVWVEECVPATIHVGKYTGATKYAYLNFL